MNLHFLGKSFNFRGNTLKTPFYKTSAPFLKYGSFRDFNKNNLFKNNFNLKKSNPNISREKIPRKNTYEKKNIQSSIFTKKTDIKNNNKNINLKINKRNNNKEYINTEISDSLDSGNNNILLDEINNYFKSKKKDNLFDYSKDKNTNTVFQKSESNEKNNNSNNNISNRNSQRIITSENDSANIVLENSEKPKNNYVTSNNKCKDYIDRVFTFKQKENNGNFEKINLKSNAFNTKNYNNIKSIYINKENFLNRYNKLNKKLLINNYLSKKNNVNNFDKVKNKFNIEGYKSNSNFFKSNIIFNYVYKKKSFRNIFSNYNKRPKSLNILETNNKKYDNIMPVNVYPKRISSTDLKDALENYKSRTSSNFYSGSQKFSNIVKSEIEGMLLWTNSMGPTNLNNSKLKEKYGFKMTNNTVKPANCFNSLDNKLI